MLGWPEILIIVSVGIIAMFLPRLPEVVRMIKKVPDKFRQGLEDKRTEKDVTPPSDKE